MNFKPNRVACTDVQILQAIIHQASKPYVNSKGDLVLVKKEIFLQKMNDLRI